MRGCGSEEAPALRQSEGIRGAGGESLVVGLQFCKGTGEWEGAAPASREAGAELRVGGLWAEAGDTDDALVVALVPFGDGVVWVNDEDEEACGGVLRQGEGLGERLAGAAIEGGGWEGSEERSGTAAGMVSDKDSDRRLGGRVAAEVAKDEVQLESVWRGAGEANALQGKVDAAGCWGGGGLGRGDLDSAGIARSVCGVRAGFAALVGGDGGVVPVGALA